jgi:hypothetical protein
MKSQWADLNGFLSMMRLLADERSSERPSSVLSLIMEAIYRVSQTIKVANMADYEHVKKVKSPRV